ncbi:MAG: PilT/PilU family type 4a pilus ATPase [Deltaproteobacteria bacterium]|nr:MAG: PilT/PilU family type 4a pilus ATPase [Deltaproteobacteria bacterium]
MALFQSRRSLVQRLARSDWKTTEERDLLIEAARKVNLRAAEVAPLMTHADTAIRQLARERFTATADSGAVRKLLADAATRPPHLRGFVMRVVSRMSAEVIDPVLDELVGSTESRQRRMGWEIALAIQGPARVSWLRRAAAEADEATRLKALQQLVDEGQLKDLGPLIDAVRSEDIQVATFAVSTLAGFDGDVVTEVMIERFAHGAGPVREKAAEWLRAAAARNPQAMTGPLLDLLGEGEDSTRRLCVEILLQTGRPEEVLLTILHYAKDLVGWLRTRILDTLQTFGDEVLRPAVQLLQHEDEAIRTNALVLAERFDDPRLVGPVCRLLQDDDWWLRITACDTLGRLGDPRAVPYLVKALDDDDTRWAAIDAMGRIGDPSALKPLTRLLRDPREEVRLEVVTAIGHFSDRRLPGLLRQVRERDPSTAVRNRAAEIMRQLSERLELTVEDGVEGAAAVRSSALQRPLDKLLAFAREQGASDIHVTVGEPPMVRNHGVLQRLEGWPSLDADQTERVLFEVLSERQAAAARQAGELDLCHTIPNVGRYRTNLYRQRKGWCAAFRVIPNVPPTFGQLRIPPRLTELLDYHQGIIVVSGPAGSGKSTTLAALINLINETRPVHIITLEDPIEFVHPVKVALVNQREVGTHTDSFARALRGALREDPDVIMVGDMRDTETVRMALEAAETGHLVIATMHTTSAIQTVERLVKAFPPDEQPQVRMSLSEALKFVVCQSLVPRSDGQGRVAVFEVLKGTLSVGNLIRDNKTYQIHSQMQIGRRFGMQTRDMALMDLVEAELVSPEDAWRLADQPAAFEPLCSPRFLAEMHFVPTEETSA